MHICILYQHYLRPGEAGHARFNDYARIWAGLGHKVSVITGQAPYMTGVKEPRYRGRIVAREKDGAVDVYRMFVPDRANESFLRRALSYMAFAVTGAVGYATIDRPDVVLASSPPLSVGLGMLAIRRFSGVPVVFEVRDLWPQTAVTTGLLTNRRAIAAMFALERRCYAAAKRVIVLTEAFRDDILLRGVAPPEKVRCIPNGVDGLEWCPDRRSDSLRAELGWTGRFVALYSGAHGVANRVGQLLDAAELLRGAEDVLIATAGDGMELPALRQRVQDRGLKNVALLGPQARERMPALTASADACVAVLQRNDTFKTVYPNKVFDAMASSRPIVLAIDGAARRLVEDSGAGIFVPPEDPRGIADAILSLRGDPGLAAAMGARGRALVLERFDRRRLALDLLAELEAAARAGG